MAHLTNHRRNLAASDPKTSMDPTHKKHPYTSTTTTTTTSTTKPHPTHPHPDPTIASSTIHTISNHFSKLYTNHKALASLKPSNPPSQPRIDTHLQAKAMSVSAIIEDTSSTSFIKSNRRHRRTAAEKDNKSDEVKKLSKKESKRKEFLEGHDMKRSQDCELKESHEGFDLKIPLPGGRRRSFCNSQTELADFLACAGVKVVSVDMPPFMQVHAVDCARKACDSLEKFAAKTLAFTLKKEFDGVYGPAWHCIVGTSFGSFVTHSVGGFMYFSMDHKLYILLFKTTVQRAD